MDNQTQPDVSLRNSQFNFSNTPKNWLNNNLYISHMFDTSSIAIPYIEGLVNFSVKNVLDKIQDKQLYAACLKFIEQETSHAREHIKCNNRLNEHGYRFPSFISNFKKKLNYIRTKWSTLSIIAVGVGFECFTTIISNSVLEEKILAQPEMEIQQFWQWHMHEEIEHRSVLMDLYLHLGGGYLRRVVMLALVLGCYCYYGIKIYFGFLRVDKASFFAGLKCICGIKSFFLKSLFKTLPCFRYSYHPNQLSNPQLFRVNTK